MPACNELHGAKTGNCIRVAIALEEVSVPYVVRMVDLVRGDQRSSDYLLLNPAGKVPTFVDNASPRSPLVLSQSNAILLHLAETVPGKLLPLPTGGTRELALERFFYFIVDVIAPSHAGFFLQNTGNESGHVSLSQQVLDRIGFAETFLKETPFMAGDDFSLADVAAVTITASVQQELDWGRHPALRRWFDRVINRPSVQRGYHAFDI